jgi:hypothetical protein
MPDEDCAKLIKTLLSINEERIDSSDYRVEGALVLEAMLQALFFECSGSSPTLGELCEQIKDVCPLNSPYNLCIEEGSKETDAPIEYDLADLINETEEKTEQAEKILNYAVSFKP